MYFEKCQITIFFFVAIIKKLNVMKNLEGKQLFRVLNNINHYLYYFFLVSDGFLLYFFTNYIFLCQFSGIVFPTRHSVLLKLLYFNVKLSIWLNLNLKCCNIMIQTNHYHRKRIQ